MFDFVATAAACAPNVHISTLVAVVGHESRFQPYAIGINSKSHPPVRPKSKQEAIDTAKKLIEMNVDFDAGWGQINVRNFNWLGLTPETVFDPCNNLRAAERVLSDCYKRATKKYQPGQPALLAAFSCYNTGNFTRGFTNGYVNRVVGIVKQ